MNKLEQHFEKFRKNTIGYDAVFNSFYGEKRIVYADWIASGRLYSPIEKKLCDVLGPFIGNTHSESSFTGTTMTKAYHLAHEKIKKHVNASHDDVIITAGAGMTAVVNKFQRILGLRIPEQLAQFVNLPKELRPVVFVTHMEHHSNHTSWLETIADVIVIPPDKKGVVDPSFLEDLIKKEKNRKVKIGAFTACSNVTGIFTPYYELAKIMHENDGFCFVDFAASAPYVRIDMHPDDPLKSLDAIYFSPHKFLGGPGTSGVIIFNSKLYNNSVPDHPGGGTVDWTNPWGRHKFVSDIEAREDGGTPGFLQAIKTSLCISLKEEMGTEEMKKREEELVNLAFNELKKISGLHILAEEHQNRIGAISFFVEDFHYNLMVKMLNDRYGIQVRGGCSCAGTYGHYLLHIDPERSKNMTDKIDKGDQSERVGWVRMSIHPTMTNDELLFITNAINEVIINKNEWSKDYQYSNTSNEFYHKSSNGKEHDYVNEWLLSV